jgi:hypothetical protein
VTQQEDRAILGPSARIDDNHDTTQLKNHFEQTNIFDAVRCDLSNGSSLWPSVNEGDRHE